MELQFNTNGSAAKIAAAHLDTALSNLGLHPEIKAVGGEVAKTFYLHETPAAMFPMATVEIVSNGDVTVRFADRAVKPVAGYNNGTITVQDADGTVVLATDGTIGDLKVAGPFGLVHVHTWMAGYAASRDADVERALSERSRQKDLESFNF